MSNDKYKVVYFLGAGASCKNHALPLVADYSQRLKDCGDSLRGIDKIKEYMDSLHWLAEMGNKHNTVDSFAKWCSRNDKGSLERVKSALAFFFSFEELVNGKRDTRYVQFITEIISDELKFPTNVKIINWNYDTQVQLACDMNTKQETFANRDGKNVHVPGIVHYYPTMSDTYDSDTEFDMVQMNGIARMYLTMDKLKRLRSPSIGDMKPFMDAITFSSYDTPVFNFAFERGDDGTKHAIQDRMQIAGKMVLEADIVVVIGYSFPSVNDVVDNALFELMKNNDGIKKIYLQSPSLTIDGLRRRFDLPEKTIIEPVNQLDSFHVALEYRRPKPEDSVGLHFLDLN
jgi:hypothetical protein